MIINNSMYPIANSVNLITEMKQQFDKLQTQLATGQKATSLAELGSSRLISLSLRSRISSIDSYKSTSDTLNLRISVLNQALSQLSQIQSTQRTATTVGDYGTDNVNFTVQPQQAQSNLDLVLTTLNSQENGRYLFAGNDTGQAPVADTDTILNGDPSRGLAGFNQVAAERLQADQGINDMGRLTTSLSPTTASTTTPPSAVVTLSEDGDHPFGYKLGTLSGTGSAISLTAPASTDPQPRSETVQFNTQPAEGDTVTFGLALPDGTSTSISLKAVTADPPGAGEFTIGADLDTTAANFQAALTSQIQATSKTDLAVASRYAAANNFFNGQGETVQRVDTSGGSAATATALRDATPADTVMWYTGQNSDTPADATQSVTAKVGDSTTIAYGMQATESGFVGLVRNLAVMATSDFSGDAAKSTYDATVSRQLDNLSSEHDTDPGSIKTLTVGLGLSQSTAKAESDRQTTYQSQLENMLGNVENIDNTTVTEQILALQTQLQASYQTTAIISKLSLVNYMS